ncbi:MAG: PspC domain-containing protein [Acutalibacteraceae bacterium]
MEKKLYCSPDKKLLGVCGGIADYFNIDPTIIRLAVSLIAIYTAIIPTLIVYLIMALIMPKAPDDYYQIYRNTSKKITKGHDKKLAGVCSGIAERFGFDPTIVRVIFVLLVVVFGSGILAYIVCALIMPKCEDYEQYPPYGAPYNPPYQSNPYYQPNQNGNPAYQASNNANNQNAHYGAQPQGTQNPDTSAPQNQPENSQNQTNN